MKEFPTPVGERIRGYRKKKGLSQVELAEKSNLNVLTIRRAENNYYETSKITIVLLAMALDVAPVNFYDPDKLREFMAGYVDDSTMTSRVRRSEQMVHDYTFIERYNKLPKRYSNQFFKFTFTNEVDWYPVLANDSEHLFGYGLESGNSIRGRVKIDVENALKNKNNSFNWIYTTVCANDDIAVSLLDLESEVEIEVVAKSVYGTIPDSMHSVHGELYYKDLTGFLIEKIVKVEGEKNKG